MFVFVYRQLCSALRGRVAPDEMQNVNEHLFILRPRDLADSTIFAMNRSGEVL